MVLWKYDSELGVAYFCPYCKTYICSRGKCKKCGKDIDWSFKEEYLARVKWE